MFAKLLLKDGEQWNRPDSRLRLRSLPVTVLIELPTDAYLVFVEVDVFPAQRKRRRCAKPRSRESRNDRSAASRPSVQCAFRIADDRDRACVAIADRFRPSSR